MNEPSFNQYLSDHAGHTMKVVEYLCGICGKTNDFMLRCIQEEIDGTCFDDPAGVASQLADDHQCILGTDKPSTLGLE